MSGDYVQQVTVMLEPAHVEALRVLMLREEAATLGDAIRLAILESAKREKA